MLSILFVLGVLVGVGAAVIAVSAVVIAAVRSVAWVNATIVGARQAARRAQSAG